MGKLAERVTKLVANHFGIPSEDIAPNVNLAKDLGARKTDTISLKTAIQTEFGIDVEDADLDRVVTVQDIIDLIVFS